MATDVYDDIPFTLKYPTVDQVVQKIQEYGPTCLLYKVDLERAFRNLKVDPLYYPLLGLCWRNDTFIDISVPFGFKFGAAACQMCTDLVMFTLRKRGSWLINYLDDYVGVAPPAIANSHFQALLNTLQFVGLPINMKKVEQPSDQITCLGIQINARTGVLKIPDDKMQEVVTLCRKWAVQTHATKNQLQKLTGKLLYVHRCAKPARIFINRILTVLRNAPQKGTIQLPSAFFRDINWCNRFLQSFNGTVEIHKKFQKPQQIFVDASLQEVGAKCSYKVYSCIIPEVLKEVGSIVHFEAAANILLAVRCWCKEFKNKTTVDLV